MMKCPTCDREWDKTVMEHLEQTRPGIAKLRSGEFRRKLEELMYLAYADEKSQKED
jgi:hypothetical protein